MDIFVTFSVLILFLCVSRGPYGVDGLLKDVPLPYNGLKGLLDSLVYLKTYGYIEVDPAKGGNREHLNSVSVENGISHFQRYMGLNITGTLDHSTMDTFYYPRCGCVDPIERNPSLHSLGSYTLSGGKWNKTHLTYKFAGQYPAKLSRRSISEETRQAFEIYSKVTPLTFEEVRRKSSSDIEIHFTASSSIMDGPGKSVGIAYPPFAGDTRTGKIYLDADEDYTIGETEGVPYLAVVLHQIGHVLGLGHTSDHSSIMAPCVKKPQQSYSLGEEDIKGLTVLYAPTIGLESTTHGVETSHRDSGFCSMGAFNVVSLIDGIFYLIKDRKLWKIPIGSDGDASQSISTNQEWPEIVDDIRAVFKNSFNKTVVITTSKMYEYNLDGNLLSWSPLRRLNIPKNIDAAFSFGGDGAGNTFIFRGSKVWLFNEATRLTETHFISSRRLWNINLKGLTATFIHEGFLHFIFGNRYTMRDLEILEEDNTYEGNFVGDFLHCEE